MKRVFTIMAALLMLSDVASVAAQNQTGGVSGVALNNNGAGLPGATVTLTGEQGAPLVQVTNSDGAFRFRGLEPGSYDIKIELEGFKTITYPGMRVAAGRNGSLEVTMQAGPIAEAITVSVAGLTDLEPAAPGVELQDYDVEYVRAPGTGFGLFQESPGVLTDRTNVGGNESDLNALYVHPGAAPSANRYYINGAAVEDPSALGSSTIPFSQDAIQELQVTWGGPSARATYGGILGNVVTKTGTNTFGGSASFYDAFPSNLESPPPLNYNLDGSLQFGATFGGPIIRDRLWFFGSGERFSRDFIFSEAGTPTDETGDTTNGYGGVSLNLDKIARLGLTYLYANRNVSGQPTLNKTPDAVWNTEAGNRQLAVRINAGTGDWIIEASYARYVAALTQTPQGGLNTSSVLRDEEYSGSYAFFDTTRPQQQFNADASSFFDTGGLSHELKFGAGYRAADSESNARWANDQLVSYSSVPGQVTYIYPSESTILGNHELWELFVSDRLAFDRATIQAGVHVTHESGVSGPNQFLPNPRQGLIPGAREAEKDTFDWSVIAPRVGLTYALDQHQKSLLRAGYARYGQAAGDDVLHYADIVEGNASFRGAIGTNAAGNVLGVFAPQQGTPAFNIPDNQFDPDLRSPITDELLIGIEHGLLPGFVVGVNLTYRKINDALTPVDLVVVNGITRLPATPGTYEYDRTFTGTVPNYGPYSVDVYSSIYPYPTGSGTYLTNTDATQSYTGASLTFNKRLANRWMLRGNFTFSDWTWSGSENPDPTPRVNSGREGESVAIDSPSQDKPGVYINSNWSYDVNGLYQIAPDRPWGFNVSASINGRQGYPVQPYLDVTRGDGRSINVQVVPTGDLRYPDIHLFDVGIRKPISFKGETITIEFDAFNVGSNSSVLQQESNIQQPQLVWETVSPRVLRIGARLNFR